MNRFVSLLSQVGALVFLFPSSAKGFVGMGTATGFVRTKATMTYANSFFATPTMKRNRSIRVPSCLSYRDHKHPEDSTSQAASLVPDREPERTAWWMGLLAVTSKSTEKDVDADESQQAVVDDYLEFLDRRYHRLYDDHRPSQSESKFSAWKWIMQNGGQESENRDDALHVLGVAELASERLLQKHHLAQSSSGANSDKGISPARSNDSSANVLETTARAIRRVEAVYDFFSALLARLLLPISSIRNSLIRFQSQHLGHTFHRAFKALLRAPSKVAYFLVHASGGKDNLKLTATFTATVVAALCFFIVRPLAQLIVSEGTRA